jgi:hypothetical protein
MNATYTPGIQDIELGQAILTLTAYRDDVSNSDDLILSIQRAPFANAGESGEVCSGLSYVCADAVAENSASLLWATSGDGIFDDPALLHPTYTPGTSDRATGIAYLTLTATGSEPCGEVSHSLPLTVKPLPAVPPVPEGPTWVDLYYTPSSTFTSSGSDGSLYYSWNIEPGTAGNMDSEGTQCMITWNPEFLGTATVRVKGLNDCGESLLSEGLDVLIGNTVGFEEKAISQNVKVMPNPNSGLFTLEITPPAMDKVSIRITDAAGSVIISEKGILMNGMFSQSYRINKPGMYFLSVDGSTFHEIAKIVIR